mgnify:CR=1 FL=1
MVDNSTTRLRLSPPTVGGDFGTWGSVLNADLTVLDDAISGQVSIDLTGLYTHTLTVNDGASDEARYYSLQFTGTGVDNATVNVVLPANQKFYWVQNKLTGANVSVQLSISGSVATIPNDGSYYLVYADGVNVSLPALPLGNASGGPKATDLVTSDSLNTKLANYLALASTTNQIVSSEVTFSSDIVFQGSTVVPAVKSWSGYQAVGAIDAVNAFQPKGSYQAAGIYVSSVPATSGSSNDLNVTSLLYSNSLGTLAAFGYKPSGVLTAWSIVTRDVADSLYQPKGNYQPAGTYVDGSGYGGNLTINNVQLVNAPSGDNPYGYIQVAAGANNSSLVPVPTLANVNRIVNTATNNMMRSKWGGTTIQSFITTGTGTATVKFPVAFSPIAVPILSLVISKENIGNQYSRIAVIQNDSNGNMMVDNTGFTFEPVYLAGSAGASNTPWTLHVTAIGYI